MEIGCGALYYIKAADAENNFTLQIVYLQGNVALGEGAALYILDRNSGIRSSIHIENGSSFINNSSSDSVVYISAGSIKSYTFVDTAVRFTKNTGSAIHLISSTFVLGDDLMFSDNFANNGEAIYLEGVTQIHFVDIQRNPRISVHFCYSSAAHCGGAICIELSSSCSNNVVVFYSQST